MRFDKYLNHRINPQNETSECWAGKWRGIAEDAAEIEAITRYSYEQGLAVRKLSPEDLFHKSTFEMSRI